jgi:hypothetical protein
VSRNSSPISEENKDAGFKLGRGTWKHKKEKLTQIVQSLVVDKEKFDEFRIKSMKPTATPKNNAVGDKLISEKVVVNKLDALTKQQRREKAMIVREQLINEKRLKTLNSF